MSLKTLSDKVIFLFPLSLTILFNIARNMGDTDAAYNSLIRKRRACAGCHHAECAAYGLTEPGH